MKETQIYEVRNAIAALPGKTIMPWRDGDERCHCSHCDLCGDCYPTAVISIHRQECFGALLAALAKADQPAPTETVAKNPALFEEESVCPHCGAPNRAWSNPAYATNETAPQGAPQSTCEALLSAVRAELAECNCPCCQGNLVLATGGVVK